MPVPLRQEGNVVCIPFNPLFDIFRGIIHVTGEPHQFLVRSLSKKGGDKGKYRDPFILLGVCTSSSLNVSRPIAAA